MRAEGIMADNEKLKEVTARPLNLTASLRVIVNWLPKLVQSEKKA